MANRLTTSSDSEVVQFLQKAARTPVAAKPSGRLIFALDATASRQPTWDRACQLQGDMFAATADIGGLAVQLVWYRGYGEFQVEPWLSRAADLQRRMTSVQCRGGLTQIGRVLEHATRETRLHRVNALVLVGDCLEETVDPLCQQAGQLGLLGVPAFVFQEGDDPDATLGFREIARLTRGAYCTFDKGSARQLRELLTAVAVYATGGHAALEEFGRRHGGLVRQLTRQLLSKPMLIRVLLVAAVLIGLYLLVRKLRRSGSIARLPRLLAAAGIAGFLMLLTVRGGAEIAMPLLAVLAPLLLRWLRLPSPSSTATGQTSPNQSAVTTRFLVMTLDHVSGVMTGTVREGRFAGRSLQDLTRPELLELWRECQPDLQSAAVLEAYLDRHADAGWREQADTEWKDRTHATENDRMDRAEAYRVLGLQSGAGNDEIQAAYRRLIQRVHPDQGGSSYLAARINQARDVLLRQ